MPCSQKAEPPQSRQDWRRLLCPQKPEPPQSRQYWRCLSCGHLLRMRRFTGCGAGGGVAGTAAAASMVQSGRDLFAKLAGVPLLGAGLVSERFWTHSSASAPPRCSKGSAGAARLTIGGWHTGHPVGHHVKEVPKEVRPSRGEWNLRGRMVPLGEWDRLWENGTFWGRMVPLGEWDL